MKKAILVFRDAALGNRPMMAMNKGRRFSQWKLSVLYDFDAGYWEPTYDTGRWIREGILSLFFQKASQPDGEGHSAIIAEPVRVLDISF